MKKTLFFSTLLLSSLIAAPAWSHHAAEGIVSDEIWQMIDANLVSVDSPHLDIDFTDIMGSMSVFEDDDGDLYLMTSVIAYPLNIGGRPLHSWVSFIPPTFELTILFAAFTAGITMMALNGLPQPYHPIFNAPRFSHASQDAFFLAIEASDPRFSEQETRAFLEGLNPREVVAVEH